MRIISGITRGRRLYSPKSHCIRPAADKVKGAIFNILGNCEGTFVLDLFAGTGNVGLEAISRGASGAVFVDCLQESMILLRKNIQVCRFQEKSKIFKGRLPKILSKVKKYRDYFDLIFVDPPYDKNLIVPTLLAIHTNKLIDAQSMVIVEHSPRESPLCDGFDLVDQRKYGQTFVSFLKCVSA